MERQEQMKFRPCVTDYYAKPRTLSPCNPWEAMLGKERKRALRQLGVTVMPTSDYEAFALWHRLVALCPGSGVSAWSEKEREWLQMAGKDPKEDWRSAVSLLTERSLGGENLFAKEGVNPIRIGGNAVYLEDDAAFLCDVLSLSHWAAQRSEGLAKESRPHIFVTLPQAYGRPDPYHTERTLERIKNGEKIAEEDACAIRLQALILLLRALPREATPVIHWQADLSSEGSRRGFAYLRERGGLRGELRIRVSLSEDPSRWMDHYLSSREELVTYCELVLKGEDLGQGLQSGILRLAERYPLGGIRFGGIDTDSAFFFLAHRIFREALLDALERLCHGNEEQIRRVASVMLDSE